MIQSMGLPDDLPGLIAYHRRALAAAPDDPGTRFLLANCLYASGEHGQAEAEWQVAAASGGAVAEMVAETLQLLSRRAGESAA